MYDDSEGEEPEWVQHERETFKDVRDANGDGFLDFDEVSKKVPHQMVFSLPENN